MKLDHVNKPYSATIKVDHMAFLIDYDRFLCSLSLHGFVRNQEKVSQAYEMSKSKKRVRTKQKTLHFLLETEHASLNVWYRGDVVREIRLSLVKIKGFKKTSLKGVWYAAVMVKFSLWTTWR